MEKQGYYFLSETDHKGGGCDWKEEKNISGAVFFVPC